MKDVKDFVWRMYLWFTNESYYILALHKNLIVVYKSDPVLAL